MSSRRVAAELNAEIYYSKVIPYGSKDIGGIKTLKMGYNLGSAWSVVSNCAAHHIHWQSIDGSVFYVNS